MAMPRRWLTGHHCSWTCALWLSRPLRHALAAFAARMAAAEAARAAERLDRRAQAALQAGLADAEMAVSALTNVSLARAQTLVWTDSVRHEGGRAVVESACVLAGVRLARASGRSRSEARRMAAVAALQRLAGMAGDAEDTLLP